MAFNWFRRQFTRSENVPEPQVEEGNETVSAEEEKAPETEDSQIDYLAWAKAAYQNIQQRQPGVVGTEIETAEDAEDKVTEPPQVESDLQSPTDLSAEQTQTEPAKQTERLDSESLETDSLETVPSEPELSEPEVSESVEVSNQPEVMSDTEPLALETDGADETVLEAVSSPMEESEPSLPIWARAETDRQARLERLKATAIEESAESAAPVQPTNPTPAPVPTELPQLESLTDESLTEATETTTVPSLDEGFLWSAEVLAAQGRRPEEVSEDEITWLKKLRQGLDKTRRGVVNQLKTIVGKGPLTQDAVLEIEALLLQADVGVSATDTIIDALQQKMLQETLPPDAAIAYLKKILRDILDAPLQSNYSATFAPQKDVLNIWLLTGVNGAGKTTTLGKLTHVATESGYACLVAAADTFRAAAVEQVKVWASRSGVEVIANPGQNTDPAAVVFDAIAAAQSRNIELLLVDTAGRLQNKKNLMDELRKVRQVIDKKAPQAKVESLLVLDATLGQNGLRQAQVFSEAAQLSGVVLTKLDGTAKGGVALAVVQELGLPIRFIGAGEGIKDLRPFSSYEFVEALLSS